MVYTRYRLGGKYQKAISYFKRIADNNLQSRYRDISHYQIARTFFEMGEYNESIGYIEHKTNTLSSENTALQMKQLLGMNYLFQRRWKDAKNHFSGMILENRFNPLDSLNVKLERFANTGMRLPYKSKFLAGVTSTLIPGTGKIYVGKVGDGLFSLLMIGLYSWQAIDGFNKKGARSIKGWIYGSLGTVFYLGNIYGSVVAAEIHNQMIEDNLLHKLELKLILK